MDGAGLKTAPAPSTRERTDMDNDHGITGELREWWVRKFPIMDSELHKDFTAVAGRIDAEHEEALLSARNHGYELCCKDAYEAAYQDGENAILAVFDKRGNADVDKTMAEHGWYRALDADNVPWHIGDRDEYGNEVTSIRMAEDGCFYFTAGGGLPCRASIHRHYHASTVEDVLKEFAFDVLPATCMADHEVTDAIERFAPMLRLAGDAE